MDLRAPATWVGEDGVRARFRGVIKRWWRQAIWLVTVISALIVFASASGADQLPSRPITLTSPALAGATAIDLDELSFDEAVTALTDGASAVRLPVFPDGGVDTTLATPNIQTGGDGNFTIAITSTTSVFGLDADVLVSAVWDDAADTGATTAVVFDARGADLTDLVTAVDLPIEFSNTLIAVSRSAQELDGDTLPPNGAAVLSDGSSFDPTMTIADGISLRALVDVADPVLADGAAAIGLEPELRLTGTLAGAVGPLFGDAATDSTEVALTASVNVVPDTGDLPDYVAPTGTWTIGVAAGGGSLAASIDGALAVSVGGQAFDVAASVGVTYSPDPDPADPATSAEVIFDLAASVGPIADLFDQDWIDLDELTLDVSVSSVEGLTASLAATLDLADLFPGGAGETASVTFDLAANSGGGSGTLNVDASALTVSVPLGDVVRGLGGVGDLVADTELTLSNFALSLAFDTADGFTGVAALSSRAGLNVGETNLEGDLLLRADFQAAGPQFLLALDADFDQLNLRTIFGPDLPFDVGLNALRLSVSSEAVSIGADDLDAATAAFVGADEDFDVPSGVVFGTDIQLEQEIVDLTGALGIRSDGLLRTELRLPLPGFTDLDTSVTVRFPSLEGDGPLRSGEVSLEAKLSEGSFSFKIVGEADVAVPRDQDPNCQSEPAASSSACEDVLTFRLDASVAAADGSFGITLGGELKTAADGWRDPTGLRGMTIFGLRLEGGVEIKAGLVTVNFGFRGQLRIDGISPGRTPIALTTAFAFAVTPTPPYVIPEGFTFATNELGIEGFATLGEVLIQEPIPALDLPDTLRLEDVFVSVSTVTNPDLCLTQGFTIQAQLHLGGQQDGDATPPCTPQRGSDLTADCGAEESCLAAVSISAETRLQGTPGLAVDALVPGFDIGVIESTGAELRLRINPTEQSLFLQGAARLRIPRPSPQAPLEIAQASVLVDFAPTRLIAEIDATLGDPAGAQFGVFLRGEARLDLAEPNFVFTVEFDTALLDELAAAIEQGVNDMVVVIDNLVVISTEDALVFNNLQTLLESKPQSEVPVWLRDVVAGLADTETAIRDANQTFVDLGLPEPFVITEVVDITLNGVQIRSAGSPAIDDGPDSTLGVDGCLNVQGRNADGNCYVIPPFELIVPGLCADGGVLSTAPADVRAVLCGDFSLSPTPSIAWTRARSFALVTNVLDDQAEATLGAPLPTGLDAETLLATVAPTIAGGSLAVECGSFVLDTVTGEISDQVVTMQLGSRRMLVDLEVDVFETSAGPLAGPADGVRAVLGDFAGTGAASGAGCGETSAQVNPNASIAFEASPGSNSFVPSGSAITGETTRALVVCDVATAFVRFGDGSGVVEVDLAGGNDAPGENAAASEVIAHTWLRDSAGAPFRPIVECGDGRNEPTSEFFATNAPVEIDAISFAPAAPAKGDRVEVRVAFTDPGDDAHTVTLTSPTGGPLEAQLPTRVGDARGDQRVATFILPTPVDEPDLRVTVEVSDGEFVDDDSESVLLAEIAPTVVGVSPYDVVGDGSVSAGDPSIVAAEGQAMIWQLVIADPNLAEDVSATVTFADGSSTTIDSVGAQESEAGPFGIPVVVSGAAQRSVFFERTEPASGPTDWSVTLTDESGLTTTNVETVSVAGVAPTIVGVTAPGSVTRTSPFTIAVAASDPGGGVLEAVVDWGDGTTGRASASADGNGDAIIEIDHRYVNPAGQYPVSVTVIDGDGLTSPSTLQFITVTPAAPTITSVTLPAEVDEYENFDVSAVVAGDGGGENYKVSIMVVERGEGTTTGPFGLPSGTDTVVRTLRISDDESLPGFPTRPDGLLTVRVTVTSLTTGLSSFEDRTIRVSNRDPIIEGTLVDGPAPIAPGDELVLIVRYTDPGLTDEHAVTIDWGDGTQSGPTPFINLEATNRQVVGLPHVYAAGSVEPYLAKVTVTDDDGGSTSTVVPITVTEPAPQIDELEPLSESVEEGTAGTVALSFSDATENDTHTIDIDWGDGTQDSVPATAGTRELAHTWVQDGTYTVAVVVTDASGLTATV